MWGVACFVASLVLTSGGFGVGAGNFLALVGILVATLVGHVAGNLLGLARLRLMVVVVIFSLGFFLASLSGVALGALALFLIVGVLAALGGYLGVASRLDVVASWFPLSFAVGGAVIWMNAHGAVATFETGQKHALWDFFTLTCLSVAVFLMLVFLATRNSLALTVWQEVSRPRVANAADDASVTIARPGRGSFVVLFVFTIFVIGSTALLSPYLFRTAESENGDPSSHPHDHKDSQHPKPGKQAHHGKPHGSGSGSGSGSKHGHGNHPGHGSSTGDGPSSGNGHGDGPGDGDGQGDGAGNDDGAGGGADDDAGSGSGSSGHGSAAGHGRRSGHGAPGHAGQGHGGAGTGSGGAREQDDDGDGASDDDTDESDEPLGKPDGGAAEEAGRQAFHLGFSLIGMLLAIAIAILLFFLGPFPPMRRGFLLRHLEKPIWPVSPTARVMNLWRRALATLAVLEIEPAAGETPRDFAGRAEGEVRTLLGCEAPGLKEAAAIVEKIDYAGRGLGMGEEQTVREAVMTFVRTVEARIAGTKKFAAAWGRAPEVES
jgi:hypothetical protein